MRLYRSEGDGEIDLSKFKAIGKNVIFEDGVKIFHPENIIIEDNVYIGHYTILKGYHKNLMIIKKNTWIGQMCFFHSAGNITIGESVGIGPGVKIITSTHKENYLDIPIIENELEFKEVVIGNGCDIGINTIVLPGCDLGVNVQVGAGSVVTKSFPSQSVIAGIPARLIRMRK